MVDRRGIELFARDYPHDYPEVEAVLLLHFHKLEGAELPVRMRSRAQRRLVDQRPALDLLHDQGDARDPRRPAARAADDRGGRLRRRHRRALDLMESRIQIVAIVVTARLFGVVFELVRRRRLMERYALLWLFASAILLALVVWRGLLETLASHDRHLLPAVGAVRDRVRLRAGDAPALLAVDSRGWPTRTRSWRSVSALLQQRVDELTAEHAEQEEPATLEQASSR